MATSRVADALDGLVSLLTAALEPTRVVDGPLVTEESLNKVVGIGYDGDRDGDFAAVIDWEQILATVDGEQDETFSVLGYVSCWTGDTAEMKARRDEAFELLDLVQNAINADPTLGGLPVSAEFASGQLFQESGKFGEQARITFTILVRAI